MILGTKHGHIFAVMIAYPHSFIKKRVVKRTTLEHGTEGLAKMNDLIERKAAKEAYCKKFCHPGVMCPDSGFCREVDDAFDSVPSAQPETIKCKDCKYWKIWEREALGTTNISTSWLPCREVIPNKNWFCGYAERREDERLC